MSGVQSPYHAAGTPAAEPAPSDSELALALATKLLCSAEENGVEADDARAELGGVTRPVSDLVADELVRRMADDALAVCAVFSNHTVPLWFVSSRDKLIGGLEEAQAREPLVASFLVILRTMPIRKESLENAGLGRRLASVLARPWVMAFVWLPALAATAGALTVESPTLRLGLLGGVVALFVVAFAVDARLRRCPACRRFLAAMPVGTSHTGTHTEQIQVTTPSGGSTYVDQDVHSYRTLWRCACCQHRW